MCACCGSFSSLVLVLFGSFALVATFLFCVSVIKHALSLNKQVSQISLYKKLGVYGFFFDIYCVN